MCDFDCNFNADVTVCDWENDQTSADDFDWSVAHGSMKSFTGPTRDQESSVTGGRSGGYAYIDSAYPRRPGDKARLQMSKTLTTEEPQCLSFYVNMFGAGIGSLSVLLQNSNNNKISPIWEMKRPASSPRDMWHKAKVTIGREIYFLIKYNGWKVFKEFLPGLIFKGKYISNSPQNNQLLPVPSG